MRIRVQRQGMVAATVLAVVGTLVLYGAATTGVAAWHRRQAAPTSAAPGYLPTVIENAPDTVPTTAEHGPGGPVSVVYAGTEVDDGLTGSVARPWLTVSATTGEYRALSAEALPRAAPGAVRVSPDGTLLAWAAGDGLHLYDTTTGRARTHEVAGVEAVGPFSADGGLVLVHGAGAQVVETGSGRVLAGAEAGAGSVAGAAWRPDRTTVDLATDAGLVTLHADGGTTTAPTSIPPGAQLAWSPDGDRLADLRDVAGTFRLFLSPLRADGSLGPARRVEVPGVSMQRLLGFSGTRTVAVDAYLLESGSVERLLDVSLDRGTTTQLTTLPPPGPNWTDGATMAVATDTLVRGSFAWQPHLWPWSYASRLVASALLMFFLLGLYLTRRPRGR